VNAKNSSSEHTIEILKRDGDKLQHSKERAHGSQIDLQPLPQVLALYKTICKTNWDFDATTVKGAIIDKQKNDVRPFDFDPSASQYAITNNLWDLFDDA
jgi:hypothetical protein